MSTPPLFKSDIEQHRVPDLPPAAYYIPDFITEDEEAFLIRKIAESPQPKWKTVGTGRRLQYWGGNMSKSGVLLPEALPPFLQDFPPLKKRIEEFVSKSSSGQMALDINQVLVNEYQPGQGISPHGDGPAFEPLVATVSLGSHTVLEIFHYVSQDEPSPPMTAVSGPIAAVPLGKLLVLPRSLLLLSSSLYASHLHGISPRTDDQLSSHNVANAGLLGEAEVTRNLEAGIWTQPRGVRTSLTFRQAKRVLKSGLLPDFGPSRRA